MRIRSHLPRPAPLENNKRYGEKPRTSIFSRFVLLCYVLYTMGGQLSMLGWCMCVGGCSYASVRDTYILLYGFILGAIISSYDSKPS